MVVLKRGIWSICGVFKLLQWYLYATIQLNEELGALCTFLFWPLLRRIII